MTPARLEKSRRFKESFSLKFPEWFGILDEPPSCMIAPRKSLGQNFLRDDNIVRKIIESLDLRDDDVVVEIGPGGGALTKSLIERSRRVIGIEIDSHSIALLQSSFGDRVNLIHSDVLKIDLAKLSREYAAKLRVVGNIPYYITSEILFWLFDDRDKVKDATLMMQLEVARRLTAKVRTKDYGILSVFAQFFSVPELLFKVSKNSFFPRPKVDSAVVHFGLEQPLPAINLVLFRNIVRSTFGKRRKTLRNGLKALGIGDEILQSINFDITRRPEMLTLNDFLQLTTHLEPFLPGMKLVW